MAHVGVAALRLVVFQICFPAMPKPEKATYAVFMSWGSITARETYFTGKSALVTFVMVDEPVVVANTLPFRNPTILTLSFWGEMPIALIGWPATSAAGTFAALVVTGTIVVPWSVERYRRSVPKYKVFGVPGPSAIGA